MAIKDGARIKESSVSSGTGTINLGGAEVGHQGIVSEIGTGNQMFYWLLDANGLAWEMGIGTATSGSPDTFSRDTIIESSNGNSAINLSTPGGSDKHLIFNAPVPGRVTGDVNFDDLVLQAPELRDYSETVASPSIVSGALELDLNNGNVFEVNLTENVTSLTLNNPPASGKGGSVTLIIKQDATGGRTLTFPSSVKFAEGSAPTLSNGTNEVDVLALITTDAGTTWYCMLAGTAFA